MPEDVIHLEGEPARALAAYLTQALTTGATAMSESVQAFRAAVEANTQATGKLQQAFDAFRAGQQAKLDEALARVETEVAARVQAEADRDAIRSAIEEARTSIEADTAAEQALADALASAQQPPSGETSVSPNESTPAEPPAVTEPTPVEPPVDAAPVETPVDTAPAVVPPADGTEPAPAV